MTRQHALDHAKAYFDSGDFYDQLAPRIAIRSESQESNRQEELHRYLTEQIIPDIEQLGFSWDIVDNPAEGFGPFLLAERLEPEASFSVLTYGHGDVIRGYDDQWAEGFRPGKSPSKGIAGTDVARRITKASTPSI